MADLPIFGRGCCELHSQKQAQLCFLEGQARIAPLASAELQGFAASRLRIFYSSRLAALDNVGNEQPCIPGTGIHDIVGLRTLGKRLTCGVSVLAAVFVVEIDTSVFERDQKHAGVAVPTGTPARLDCAVSEIEF